MTVFPLLLALLMPAAAAALDQWPLKTFGCIQSQPFPVTQKEFVVCEHKTAPSFSHGAITHLQFTWSGDAQSVFLRAYIDGETAPSIDVQMEQGMFAVADPQVPDPTRKSIAVPWGNARIGRGGDKGGRYFNFRVPYVSSVRLALYANGTGNTSCFTIIRGADGASATAGGMSLPPSARLHVQSRFGERVDKFAQLPALQTSDGPGVLAMWILIIYQSNMGLTYLEGCERAWLDGALVQIGDGEDFFDSGYYFDAGVYAFPQAGLLEKGAQSTLAYRIFDSDPVVWSASANMTWRNCDTYPKCVDGGFSPPPDPTHFVGATSFVWYYTW